jgi:signal peptidase I
MDTDGKSKQVRKRRAWLAALMSLLWPGLGQIYVTDTKHGIRLIGLSVALMVALGVIFAVPPTSLFITVAFFAVGLALIALALYAAVSAFVAARRVSMARLSPANRWYVYIGLIVVTMILNQIVTSKANPVRVWDNFWTPSASMLPGLEVGDTFVVWKRPAGQGWPRRGDIAVYKFPLDNRTDYIKRIIGLPGDRVQFRGGRLYLNGAVVERREDGKVSDDNTQGLTTPLRRYIETLPAGPSYPIAEITDRAPLDDTHEYTVPAGHYFAVGDNRDNSLDSRLPVSRNAGHGFVPAGNIIGQPTFIFWAKDKSRMGMRVR